MAGSTFDAHATTLRLLDFDESNAKQAGSSAELLSKNVFADPHTYLDALRSNFQKYDADHNGKLDKKELEQYAQNGNEPDARAVARATADHFDELVQFRDGMDRAVKDTPYGQIALPNIDLIDDAMNGKKGDYVQNEHSSWRNTMLWKGGLSAAWGVLGTLDAVAHRYTWAAVAAGLTGMYAADSYDAYRKMDNADADVTAKFDKERDTVTHWKEFNK